MVTDDELIHLNVLKSVFKILGELPSDSSPQEITTIVHRKIKELVGNYDPYKNIKKHYNEISLSMYNDLKRKIIESEDSLLAAIKLAIAGNIIDYGASNRQFNLNQVICDTLKSDLAINNYREFKEELGSASRLLYIGDNAGEIVFDKLLVEEIKKETKANIDFIVRGKPILNDATIEDAQMVGLDKIVKVIPDGNDSPAFIFSKSSKKVRDLFMSSDLIIAKGQGNYESLSESEKNIYFLLRLKCRIIANDIGGKVGDNVLKRF